MNALEYYNEVQQYVGISEITPNKTFKGNKNITGEQFLNRLIKTLWRRGQAYCAYFAKIVWTQCFPEIPKHFYNGNSQEMFRRMTVCPFTTVSDKPIIGAMVLYKYHGTTGHTDTFVTKIYDDDTFDAIGGNVSDMVTEKKRNRNKAGRTLLGFIIPNSIYNELKDLKDINELKKIKKGKKND